MAWVAKDYIGEWIFNCKPDMWAGDCIEHNYWLPQDRYGAYGFQLPQGRIIQRITECRRLFKEIGFANIRASHKEE